MLFFHVVLIFTSFILKIEIFLTVFPIATGFHRSLFVISITASRTFCLKHFKNSGENSSEHLIRALLSGLQAYSLCSKLNNVSIMMSGMIKQKGYEMLKKLH